MKHDRDLSLPEVQQFFRQQQAIGIDIVAITTYAANTLLELPRKNLIVGATADIVWDISMDDEEDIALSTLITDPSKIKGYRRRIKLARLHITRLPIYVN